MKKMKKIKFKRVRSKKYSVKERGDRIEVTYEGYNGYLDDLLEKIFKIFGYTSSSSGYFFLLNIRDISFIKKDRIRKLRRKKND